MRLWILLRDKKRDIIIIVIVVLVLCLILGVYFSRSYKSLRDTIDNTITVEPYPERMNVGDINLTSIAGVEITPYVEDDWAQARYSKDGKQLFDLFQFKCESPLLSGSSLTEEFRKALVEHFGYDDSIVLTGDANFRQEYSLYVFEDSKINHTIVGLFLTNNSQYLIFDIASLPIDEKIMKVLSNDIYYYTGYAINLDLNEVSNMKKVRIKDEN